MTQTKYENQSADHASWMRWLSEMLDRTISFYEEAITNIRIIARQVISRASEALRFFISKLTALDLFFGFISLGLMGLASLFLMCGLGLVSYQVFLWIKDGAWSEFTIMVVFDFLFENTPVAQWLSNPESWFGLQKIIEWLLQSIPLSAALILPSVFIICLTACLSAMAIAFRFYQFKRSDKN